VDKEKDQEDKGMTYKKDKEKEGEKVAESQDIRLHILKVVLGPSFSISF